MEEKQYIPLDKLYPIILELLISTYVETKTTQMMAVRLVAQFENDTLENIEPKLEIFRKMQRESLLLTLKANFILEANVEEILRDVLNRHDDKEEPNK